MQNKESKTASRNCLQAEALSSRAPLVSIIIPTYNYGHFIAQTLDSILEQTFQDWECLIIDDGSADETFQVVKVYMDADDRFRYISHPSNKGLSAARNTGLTNSRGKYIQILDADDLLENKKIEKHVSYLENHPRVDIVYGNVRYFRCQNPHERLLGRWKNAREPWMPKTSGKGRQVLKALVRTNIMVVNAPLIRRRAMEEVGSFDNNMLSRSDWDYWIRSAEKDMNFKYLEEQNTLALVRWHDKSMSSAHQDQRPRIRSELYMRSKLKNRLNDHEIIRINKERIDKCNGDLGIEEIIQSNLVRGAYQLMKAGIISGKVKLILYALLGLTLPKSYFSKIVSISLRELLKRHLNFRKIPGFISNDRGS